MSLNLEPTTGVRDTLKPALYALLLFVPTLFFAGSELLLLYPFAILLFERHLLVEKYRNFKLNPCTKVHIGYVWFPLVILVLSSLNKLFNGFEINGLGDLYSAYLLLPLLILGAHFIQNPKIAYFFIILIILEVFVCIIEYLFGVRSFFISTEENVIIQSKELLYDSRVYGLSSNSSIIGLKLFCAFLLLGLANFSRRNFFIIVFFLSLGILFTFNRAVIVALLLFFFLLFVQHLLAYRLNWRKLIKSQFFVISLMVLVAVLIFNKQFSYQFSRGDSVEIDTTLTKSEEEVLAKDMECEDDFSKDETKSTVVKISKDESYTQPEPQLETKSAAEKDNNQVKAKILIKKEKSKSIPFRETYEITDGGSFTKLFLGKTSEVNASGRDLIWANYASFIENHLWFGNGSNKLMLRQCNPKTGNYELIHAHNSFLMLLATNGLLIFILRIVWMLFLWERKNTILIITVLIYSMFQYGIFWGFSLLDVIFVSLIMSSINFIPIERKETNTRN